MRNTRQTGLCGAGGSKFGFQTFADNGRWTPGWLLGLPLLGKGQTLHVQRSQSLCGCQELICNENNEHLEQTKSCSNKSVAQICPQWSGHSEFCWHRSSLRYSNSIPIPGDSFRRCYLHLRCKAEAVTTLTTPSAFNLKFIQMT